jgi:glycine/D-amino acid oxidase-like deaminating enzyme
VPPDDTLVEVAVVGAGPAGLTAALHLARAGLDVLVLDERADPGGQYLKPVAASHRELDGPLDRQFAEGRRLRLAAEEAGVRFWQEAVVWSAFGPDEIGVFHEGRQRTVRGKRLVLAPGAFERPVPIPGWILPGVMTTGAAQTLARAYRVCPGRRVVVAGNGPLNLQLAVELSSAGVEVAAVVETASPSLGDWRAAARALRSAPGLMAEGARFLALLRARGVPVLWGARAVAAHGKDRFESVSVETREGVRAFEADVLALGYGFVPSTELARQLGCRHRYVDRHVGFLATEAEGDGRTSVEAVFAVGDGASLGGAVVARERATLAADAILRDLKGSGLASSVVAGANRALRRAEAFQDALWTLFRAPAADLGAVRDETVVCRCEGVSAGAVRVALAAHGADAGTAKRLTRIGMGRCGGRTCAGLLARLVGEAGGGAPEPYAFFAPRPAVKPTPLASLALEKPEWSGHRRSTPPAIVPRPARERRDWGRRRTDALVVGAGIVGACVARELARAGEEVLVVDRDAVGQQASTANAGSLHVQLLSFDFGAKAEAGGGPAAETLKLGPPAVALWREIAEESGEDLELRITGGLMVAESERDWRFLQEKTALEARHGVETHLLRGNELRNLEPHLSTDLIGAAFCPAEGKINPLTATFAVVDQARRAGAAFEPDAPVLAIERASDGFEVATAAGRVSARRIVNCAGAWSSRIGAMVGKPIPVSGAPLQMMVTEPGPPVLSRLLAHADRHLSLKQTAAGSLLIGGGWSAGLDEATGASKALRWAMEGNAWVACRVLPPAAAFHLLRVWAGMNIAIDGAPILGEMPGVPGFYNCVTSNGYTLAPIVARVTADLMSKGRSSIDTIPFTLARF